MRNAAFNGCRRRVSLTGLGYTVWTSGDLGAWAPDPGAMQVATPIPGSDIETVLVTLSPHLRNEERMFVRIQGE